MIDHNHDLEKEISDVLALTKPGLFEEDVPVYRRVTVWIEEVAEAADAIAEKFQHGDLASLEQPTAQALVSAFDQIIVPLDVPRVPEILEMALESQVRSMIPQLVSLAFQRIASKAA